MTEKMQRKLWDGYSEYIITSDGKVFLKDINGKLIERKKRKYKNIKPNVVLHNYWDGKFRKFFIDYLLAKTFIEKFQDGDTIIHILRERDE